MSLRNRLVLPIVLSTFAVLMGCGGNGNPIANPVVPPNGSFSNSNLNGTYVFSVSGIDAASGFPYVILGTLAANGNGGITGGTIDVNAQGLGAAPVANAAINGNSTYRVGVDGRGQASLNTATQLGTIVLDFVLEDNSHGLVSEFDANATGSGTLDVQTTGAAPAGSYAFIFSGADVSSGSASASLFATVGNFTLGSGGAISSGLEDFNNNGFAYPNQAVSGQVVLGPAASPATTLNTPQFGNQTYDVYAVDATHLKFIEMDASGTLSGDAYSQTSAAVPAGTLAFTLAGSYPTASSTSAAGGFMVTDGAGNITNASTEDANNGGSVSNSPISFTGTYAAAGAGRLTFGFAGFSAGASYAAYPSSGGLLLLEIDNNSGIMVGAAYPQTPSANFTAAAGYALNLSGTNLTTTNPFTGGPSSSEVDDIAEFSANSTGATVNGVLDENYEPSGGPNFGLALSGTYAAPDANGRGQISANAGNINNGTLNGGFLLNFYTVDGTIFPFIETDSNGQIAAGVFVKQNPNASSSAIARPQMFIAPQFARLHGARRQKK